MAHSEVHLQKAHVIFHWLQIRFGLKSKKVQFREASKAKSRFFEVLLAKNEAQRIFFKKTLIFDGRVFNYATTHAHLFIALFFIFQSVVIRQAEIVINSTLACLCKKSIILLGRLDPGRALEVVQVCMYNHQNQCLCQVRIF